MLDEEDVLSSSLLDEKETDTGSELEAASLLFAEGTGSSLEDCAGVKEEVSKEGDVSSVLLLSIEEDTGPWLEIEGSSSEDSGARLELGSGVPQESRAKDESSEIRYGVFLIGVFPLLAMILPIGLYMYR